MMMPDLYLRLAPQQYSGNRSFVPKKKYQSEAYIFIMGRGRYLRWFVNKRGLWIYCVWTRDPAWLNVRQLTLLLPQPNGHLSRCYKTSILEAVQKTLKITLVRGRKIKSNQCVVWEEGPALAVLYEFLMRVLLKLQTINYEINRV